MIALAPPPGAGTDADPYGLGDAIITDDLGTVHRGHDPLTRRPVVVRLLWQVQRGVFADGRFDAKLTAAARLVHPNLVPVQAWGEVAGVTYLVTEDDGGERLSERPPEDWRAAIALLRRLAAALDHAHSRGVTHGAVRASAVVLSPKGAPRLSDFGAGCLVNEGSATAAEDVFGFSAMARALVEHVAGDRGLSPPAAAALARDTAAAPDAGYRSCGELVAALQASGPPVLEAAGALGGGEDGRRWPRKLKVAVASALVGLGASTGALLATHRHQSGPPGQAVAARSEAPAAADAPAAKPASTPRPPSNQAPTSSAPSSGAAPSAAPTSAAPPAAPAAAPASGVSIALSSSTAPRGSSINVLGRGFDPRQQYIITVVQGSRSWRVQGTASPRLDGSFSNPIQVPTDAQPGGATVVACVYIVNAGPTSNCGSRPLTIS